MQLSLHNHTVSLTGVSELRGSEGEYISPDKSPTQLEKWIDNELVFRNSIMMCSNNLLLPKLWWKENIGRDDDLPCGWVGLSYTCLVTNGIPISHQI